MAGVPLGILGGLHNIDAQNQQQYQQQEQQRRQQNAQLDAQQKYEQAQEIQRQRLVQNILGDLAKKVPDIGDQAAYDQLITMNANALRSLVGSRLNEQALRQNYPFVKPSADKQLQKTAKDWLDFNGKQLETDPTLADRAFVDVDLNGDGTPERVSVRTMLQRAGYQTLQGQNGQAVTVQTTPTTATSEFQTVLDARTRAFVAKNHRQPTDEEHQQLVDDSIEKMKTKPPAAPAPEKPVKITTKGPDGKNHIQFVYPSQVAGQTFDAPASATEINRGDSAAAVADTGNNLIQELSDPKVAAKVGPIMGRYNTLREFIGNPPPELAELAGEIESFSLANMGVHGMRSAQGAKQIAALLDRKHTPESAIAAIRGLMKFTNSYLQETGRAPKPTDTTMDPLASAKAKLGIK